MSIFPLKTPQALQIFDILRGIVANQLAEIPLISNQNMVSIKRTNSLLTFKGDFRRFSNNILRYCWFQVKL